MTESGLIWIEATFYPESPFMIGGGFESQNLRESQTFIPGSVIRGALAALILEARGWLWPAGKLPEAGSDPLADRFCRTFLDQRRAVRMTALFPVPQGSSRTNDKEGPGALWERWIGFPIPLTARQCKANSKHGIFDTALPIPGHTGGIGCPDCRERVERARGWLAYAAPATEEASEDAAAGRERHYRKVTPARRTVTRVGINRLTETAEGGMLYSLRVVDDRGVVYRGFWPASVAAWEELESLLNETGWPAVTGQKERGWAVKVGGNRARGFGRGILTLRRLPGGERPGLPSLAQRIQRGRQEQIFLLTLQSPLILGDMLLGRESDSSIKRWWSQEIFAQAGLTPPQGWEWVPELSVLEWSTVSGWSQAWRLPKAVQPALAAGSVLAYRLAETPSATATATAAEAGQQLAAFLTQVERDGLGLERLAGFGDVVVCHPFHWEASPDRSRN